MLLRKLMMSVLDYVRSPDACELTFDPSITTASTAHKLRSKHVRKLAILTTY